MTSSDRPCATTWPTPAGSSGRSTCPPHRVELAISSSAPRLTGTSSGVSPSKPGSADKQAALELRREALSLVRGEPFTADTSRYFTWAFSSAVVYKIVESVTALAHSLGTDLVLASDLPGAEWALRQGLLCDPSSLTLWEDLTDVLLETADQSLLDLHWKAAALVLAPKDVVALRSRENG